MNNPALSPAILLSPVENGYVAYDTGADRLHELNPIASLIAELCDGSRTVEQIRAIVGPLLPDGRAAEIDRWIDEGIEAGLLSKSGSLSANARSLEPKELLELAKRLRDRGKVRTAFVCQQRAAQLAVNDAKAWKYLGELAHIIGRRDDARSAYEKYVALCPDDAEIRHLLVALRGDAPPPRVPDECIQQLYRKFSAFYESNMCDELHYEGPERMRNLLASVLGDRHDLTMLELGCGSGLVGMELKPRTASMLGVDLSPEMLELARERKIYDRLEVAEIADWLGKNQDQFDLIVACDTFIYFGDLREVMSLAAKRLNKGGVFAFTVERGDRHPFHLTDAGRYTHHPEYIRELAPAAGLTVARMEEGFLRMEYGVEVISLFVALTNENPG